MDGGTFENLNLFLNFGLPLLLLMIAYFIGSMVERRLPLISASLSV